MELVKTAEETLKEKKGAFAENILRNPKQIKADRGLAIVERVELIYKRKIEDLKMSVNEMVRTKQAMIDISPSNSISFEFPTFDPSKFVAEHQNIALEIRKEKVKLNVAIEEYNSLFGHTYEFEKLEY